MTDLLLSPTNTDLTPGIDPFLADVYPSDGTYHRSRYRSRAPGSSP